MIFNDYDVKFEEEVVNGDEITNYFVAEKFILSEFGIEFGEDTVSACIMIVYNADNSSDVSIYISPSEEVNINTIEDNDWREINLNFDEVKYLFDLKENEVA